MTTTAAKTENKTFAEPDETRTFERGQVDLVDIAGTQIGRLTLEPGWRWSEHVKPIAGTDLCLAPHFQYQVQGTLRIKMGDGTEIETSAGNVTAVPEGHDAWVVGDQPVVLVDWWGASNYAKG
jgi:quercetin dioxygenase-like cupin family protein